MIRSALVASFAAVLFTLFFSPVSAADRLALIVGNKAYNEKVGPLINPHNDVKLVANALEKLSFTTTVIEDADFATLQKAIRAHAAKVRAAGDGAINFFYYSGHGAADANSSLNYLIPVDVPDADDASLWTNSVELKADIVDKFGDQAPEASHFIIFDACRNELRLKNRDMKAIQVDGQGFVAIQRSRSLIAYSTAARRTASDAGVGSGAYARILTEELVVPGIEAATMFRRVQLRIMQSIGQFPYSSIDGMPEIYLAGKDGSAAQPAEPITSQRADVAAFERERASERKSMRTLLQQIGDAGVSTGGAFRPQKKWSKKNLVICFMDGARDRRAYIASVARQWTLYGEIDFGQWDDPRTCGRDVDHDVAISLTRSGNWSYLGTDAVVIGSRDQPTMALETVGTSSEEDLRSGKYNREILHEFGHALGFDHNWKAPTSGLSCDEEFNWAEIYQGLGWSKETADLNLRGKSSAKDIVGAFDKNSIMNYELPPKYFLKGRDSPCYVTPINELSLRDKLAMFTIYK